MQEQEWLFPTYIRASGHKAEEDESSLQSRAQSPAPGSGRWLCPDAGCRAGEQQPAALLTAPTAGTPAQHRKHRGWGDGRVATGIEYLSSQELEVWRLCDRRSPALSLSLAPLLPLGLGSGEAARAPGHQSERPPACTPAAMVHRSLQGARREAGSTSGPGSSPAGEGVRSAGSGRAGPVLALEGH